MEEAPEIGGAFVGRKGIDCGAQETQAAKVPDPREIVVGKLPGRFNLASCLQEHAHNCARDKEARLPTPKAQNRAEQQRRSFHVDVS